MRAFGYHGAELTRHYVSMSEGENLATKLQGLRTRLAADEMSVDDVYDALETLTYKLTRVSADADAALREMVNDIELARFTLLPADQAAAVDVVLARAQPLFDAHST